MSEDIDLEEVFQLIVDKGNDIRTSGYECAKKHLT